MATIKNMTGKAIVIGKPHGNQATYILPDAEVDCDVAAVLDTISKVDSRLYIHKDSTETKTETKASKKSSKKTSDTVEETAGTEAVEG